MTSLMKIDLIGEHLFPLQLYETGVVAYHNVPVVESVGHKGSSPEILHIVHQVALRPEVIVIACFPVNIFFVIIIPLNTVAVFTVIGVGMNKIVKDINILSQVSSRTADKSVGTVIMII